jgi:ABC-2 type transport system ATP-binding protein
VAIVDHGKVIALGTPRELVASLGAEHVVEFGVAEGAAPERAALDALPGVREVHSEDGTTRLTVREVHIAVPALMALLAQRAVSLSTLTTHTATLEDVFLHLTGRTLRDE